MSHRLICSRSSLFASQDLAGCFVGFQRAEKPDTALLTASTRRAWGMAGLDSVLPPKRGGPGSPACGREDGAGGGLAARKGHAALVRCPCGALAHVGPQMIWCSPANPCLHPTSPSDKVQRLSSPSQHQKLSQASPGCLCPPGCSLAQGTRD